MTPPYIRRPPQINFNPPTIAGLTYDDSDNTLIGEAMVFIFLLGFTFAEVVACCFWFEKATTSGERLAIVILGLVSIIIFTVYHLLHILPDHFPFGRMSLEYPLFVWLADEYIWCITSTVFLISDANVVAFISHDLSLRQRVATFNAILVTAAVYPHHDTKYPTFVLSGL